MKRCKTILLLALIIIGLYLPDIIRKPRFHIESLDSMVEVFTYFHTETSAGISNSGSGFVLSNTGSEIMIATCEHVIDDESKKIKVRVGEENYPAKVVCSSEYADLAIISIEAELDIPPATLSEAGLFSTVYAAGYPGSDAYDHSIYFDKSTGMVVTQGKVKYILGGFDNIPFQIVHTAIEDFGSSGGQLLNWKGETAGVVAFERNGDYGAISSWELMKLCKEAGVEYTHHLNFRLVKDLISVILFSAILSELISGKKEVK